MRILITNDDGIHAEGLRVLERIARTISDDVWVVAPEQDQSGYAHSLSISNPLRLQKTGDRSFALRGTPTDCVIMGIRKLLPAPPDLVLSGVNSGCNIADDVMYSGTVASAMEAAMLGVRSIALSQEYLRGEGEKALVPYKTSETLAPDLLKKLLSIKFPEGILLNVNYPACEPEKVAGIRVTSQGKFDHCVAIEERQDGRGLAYFWLRFSKSSLHSDEGTDVEAIRNDFVSVTPLHLDLTAYAFQKTLSRALL